MRNLTFESYLKQYIQDVSGQKSLSIHKLSKMSETNVRIISPLILYCVYKRKSHIFLTYFDREKYNDIPTITTKNFLDPIYAKYDFEKIYLSFIRRSKTKEYDNQIKEMIRLNILEMMENKSITKYRIYTSLKLNAGNVNDYLTNNNCNKISLFLAKEIYRFCEAY